MKAKKMNRRIFLRNTSMAAAAIKEKLELGLVAGLMEKQWNFSGNPVIFCG